MANFLRMLLGLALLPMCWGMTRALIDGILGAAGADAFCWETWAFLGGIGLFVLCWCCLPHLVRTYVFGHELTHALWGLLFGATPSRLKVNEDGGSVNLSKTNLLISLAPYFFPFYTFVVVLVALIVFIFVRPLPWLPLWMFLIGFTWAFHVLFTLETLSHRQPDVTAYGRIFSWVFIYLMNGGLILLWLATMTSLTFLSAGTALLQRVLSAYLSSFEGIVNLVGRLIRLFYAS